MPRRTWTAPALAALLLLPAALSRADEPEVKDKDLEGEWRPTGLVIDGHEIEQDRENGSWTIHGESLLVKSKDRTGTIAIKIDATKTPKAIDIIDTEGAAKGKPARGIYEIKGDELRICVADAGKDRPTEFPAKEGTGWTVLTFKRAKK